MLTQVLMDGSDDYFPDDLVLDDQVLAVLDQEERRHFTQVAQPPQVPKRQRTEAGWKPGLGLYTNAYDDKTDNMPEVSLRGDGTYDISTAREFAPMPSRAKTQSGQGGSEVVGKRLVIAPKGKLRISSNTKKDGYEYSASYCLQATKTGDIGN